MVTSPVTPESRLTFSPEVMKIIDSVPLGVLFVDATGKMRYVNAEGRRIWEGGLPRDIDAFRALVAWWSATGQRVGPDEMPIVQALEGIVTSNAIMDVANSVGRKLSLSISAAPIRNIHGNVLGAITIFGDVTEQRERENLSEISRRIKDLVSSTLHADDVLPQVLREVSEAVGATQSVVYLNEDEGWAVGTRYGRDTLPEQALLEAQVALAQQSGQSGQVLCVTDTAEEEDGRHAHMAQLGVGAFISQAIVRAQKVTGNVAVYFGQPRACSTAEIDFVRDAAFSIGRALTISAQYRSQEEVASVLQSALLDVAHEVPGVEYRASYTSAAELARVGGDFYDMVPLPNNMVGFVLGDVSGKGLDAAKMMMATKNALRAYLFTGIPPDQVVFATNRLLEATTASDKFVTLFCGVVDTNTGLFEYCSAGHPTGLIRRRTGQLASLANTSTFVGAFADAEFRLSEGGLEDGDYLFLYSDGAIEASREDDGELFGINRLRTILENTSFDDVVDKVASEVARFTGGQLKDDMVLLAVRMLPKYQSAL